MSYEHEIFYGKIKKYYLLVLQPLQVFEILAVCWWAWLHGRLIVHRFLIYIPHEGPVVKTKTDRLLQGVRMTPCLV